MTERMKSIMIKPFTFDREDTCPSCKSERSIEAYDYNDRSLRLTLSIDTNRSIKYRNIKYLKCRKCGKRFFPKWNTEYPTPMSEDSFELFMNGYKYSSNYPEVE